ncbi:hypothetical protein SAMN06269250_3245 [Spirosoma fluviale]|uniref:Uncharacterized protein n=1 Tax=Spirosoma fluviale TaxID=1597977 RepID=A0A286G474_9BACT|nr:hypothetical protein SAMN06269250_3245 [Spirosoma fluviale]
MPQRAITYKRCHAGLNSFCGISFQLQNSVSEATIYQLDSNICLSFGLVIRAKLPIFVPASTTSTLLYLYHFDTSIH